MVSNEKKIVPFPIKNQDLRVLTFYLFIFLNVPLFFFIFLVETIANNELAPVDEEILGVDCQQWEISDWAGLPDRVQGPIMEVGGYRW
jgi:hypothetical protein